MSTIWRCQRCKKPLKQDATNIDKKTTIVSCFSCFAKAHPDKVGNDASAYSVDVLEKWK